MKSIYCVHCTLHSETCSYFCQTDTGWSKLHPIHLTKCLAHIIHTSYCRPLHLLQFTYITCVQFQQHSQFTTNLCSLTLFFNTFGRGVLLHCSMCYHLKFFLVKSTSATVYQMPHQESFQRYKIIMDHFQH